jgi:hypothetical protein
VYLSILKEQGLHLHDEKYRTSKNHFKNSTNSRKTHKIIFFIVEAIEHIESGLKKATHASGKGENINFLERE